MAAPRPAPVTVPMLQAAWNRGKIARPSSCSTAAPCTFMATSQVPLPKPKTNSPAATSGMPSPVPTAASAMPAAAARDMMTTVRVSPSQLTISPDSGVPRVDPAARKSKMRPRTPGVICSSARTCGIRAAQLANRKPLPKKTAKTALRAARTSRSSATPALGRRPPILMA